LTPKEWVLTCIDFAYSEKAIADEECDRRGLPRLSFPEFLYDLFMSLYGMRKSAEIVRSIYSESIIILL
jgi:hypothetical protein